MKKEELLEKLNIIICFAQDALTHELNNMTGLVEGTSFFQFIAEMKTVLDRHLRDHELYKTLYEYAYGSDCKVPSSIKQAIINLRTIEEDTEYFEEFDKRTEQKAKDSSNKKVFIVHGHNIEARDDLEQLLWRIGLIPVIMMNNPNGGLTLVEKFEKNIDVGFAIVLYTACDVGRDKKKRRNNPRARQNVVFEHGYLMSHLGRERVVALVEEGVEKPGDLDGLIYISMDDKDWKKELMRELREAGYNFDALKA